MRRRAGRPPAPTAPRPAAQHLASWCWRARQALCPTHRGQAAAPAAPPAAPAQAALRAARRPRPPERGSPGAGAPAGAALGSGSRRQHSHLNQSGCQCRACLLQQAAAGPRVASAPQRPRPRHSVRRGGRRGARLQLRGQAAGALLQRGAGRLRARELRACARVARPGAGRAGGAARGRALQRLHEAQAPW